MGQHTLVFAIFAGLGGLVVAIGLLLWVRMMVFMRRSVLAEGVVLEVVSRRDVTHPETRYSPRVRFEAGGQHYEFLSQVALLTAPQVGERLPIRYVRGQPATAEVHYAGAEWFGPAFIMFFGFIFLAVGVLVGLFGG